MPSLAPDAYERQLARILFTIPNASNRAVVEKYLNQRRANGLKPGSILNDANALRGLCEVMGGRPLQSATKDDVVAFVNSLSRERVWRSLRTDGEFTETRRKIRVGEKTLSIRKVLLRLFFKWMRGTDDYPPEVKWLKTRAPNGDSIPTDKVLSNDEVQAVLQAHPDNREKAMLAVLYESGLRAGEVCALNLGNVEFDEYGAVVTLPKRATGLKTGARRVRLLSKNGAVHHLQQWYEAHPRKGNPQAALFYSNSHRAPGARFNPRALYAFVRAAGHKANLQKEIHPHLFRHTAATERARQGWTEAEMRAFFGWTRSSDMPSTYVHLAGRDYEKMLFEREGIVPAANDKGGALRLKVCRVCNAENLATAFFCQACRNPVSPKAEEEIQRRQQDQLNESMASFVLGKNEELMEIVAARVLKKLGKSKR